MNIEIGRAALIVVDAQVGFVTEHSAHVLPPLARLVEGWHAAGGLVVLTRFVNQAGSPYVRLIGWTAMMPGDPQNELHPAIRRVVNPAADVIVDKNGYSALTPEVRLLLGARGITDVVVAGLDTESCVLATVLAGFEGGRTPWLVVDASASHAGAAEHQAGLLVARRFIGRGQLVTAGDVLASVASPHAVA